MDGFDYRFDKIFVLKSLGEADTYADALYSETIEPSCQRHGLTSQLIDIYDRGDWDKVIEQILQDEHRYPLIHFEMHGNEENGLALRLGDYVPWPVVIRDLTRINIRSELNLIITMAVCYSTKLAFNMSMVKRPAPYLFSVSTRLKIRGEATYRMYSVFFKELIETMELYSALKAVEKTNPDLPQMFDILAVPFLFENTFRNYALEHRDDGMVEREFYHSFPEMQQQELAPEDFQCYKNTFMAMFRQGVDECYRKFKAVFFMFDVCPQNKQRFKLPERIM